MSETGQSPVAWARFAENGNIQLWTADPKRALHEGMNGLALTPLYAHPSVMHGKLEDALREIDGYEVVAETSMVNQLFRLKNIARAALAELEKSQ